MTGKPTKQQVVDVLREEFMGFKDSPHREDIIQSIASILIKAGLVEEPRIKREPGFYWTKWTAGQKWNVSEWDGSKWIGQRGTVFNEEPDVYSRRITPPSES